ncbi:hypothetical protein PtA15_13A481 [Puccinia triticina]|uniref:Cutinase n=1 Tax=Puccinia triticina TaxID=208348 RepID=A0ABY7D2I4_9BASI|nr:uncharacterized protein PtA15_13A481 [Puccinia triticina]WAQ91080.1 hypothetical protein PtA15_13A481 [Puccinia triticina]
MAQEVMRAVPGGVLHDIKYSSSAEYMRTPKEGAQTGLTYLKEHAKKCPRMVFVLMGYSKGAMVATQILASKDLPAGKVVAVVLFGNPYYKGGLPQNKCSAKTGRGIATPVMVTAPQAYASIIWDCCNTGDMICYGGANMGPHLQYGGKKDEAKAFIISKLKAVSAGGGSGGLKDTTKETESDTGAGESTGGGLGGGGLGGAGLGGAGLGGAGLGGGGLGGGGILSIFGGGSRSGGGMGGGGSRPGGKAPKFGGMGKLGSPD